MTTDDGTEALKQAIEAMTDDEVAEYLTAGDFGSVAGIPLPAEASARVEALASGAEVQGFGLDLNLLGGGVQLPSTGGATTADGKKDKASAALLQACATGKHFAEGSL